MTCLSEPSEATDLSVVLPVFNERENLELLIREICDSLEPQGLRFEIIVVDDGSDDGSAELIESLMRQCRCLRLIKLRRNYGQAAAFDAGFRRSQGRLVATLDADGQNDPADIAKMIAILEERDLDFLSGRRARRHDQLLLRKLPSRVANWMIRCVTRTPIHDLGCSLKLYRREIVEHLHLYGEMHRFIPILVEGIGAQIGELDVSHRPRTAGKSKYGISRSIKVLLDLTTVWFMRGFETKPIYLFGGVSFCLMAGAMTLSALVLWQKVANGVFVHRNPLFILSMVTAIMSVQFLALGLLAEVLIRTYYESQHKAPYLIARVAGFERTETADQHTPASTRSLPAAGLPVVRQIKEMV